MPKKIDSIKVVVVSFLLSVAQNLVADTKSASIEARQIEQQKRIQQGIDSGKLNPTEAKRLKTQQAQIESEKIAATADGVFTEAERKHIAFRQNIAERAISRNKYKEQKLNDVLYDLNFRRK